MSKFITDLFVGLKVFILFDCGKYYFNISEVFGGDILLGLYLCTPVPIGFGESQEVWFQVLGATGVIWGNACTLTVCSYFVGSKRIAE